MTTATIVLFISQQLMLHEILLVEPHPIVLIYARSQKAQLARRLELTCFCAQLNKTVTFLIKYALAPRLFISPPSQPYMGMHPANFQ